MTYSSDDITSEVTKIVQGSPTFSRDSLGARNVKDRFNEVRELVNSVMLYEPDSVYYLIKKASVRTRRQLSSVLSVIEELEDDIDGMAVQSRAVQNTTALSDANTALSSISNALVRRGSISNAEWQRYDKATSRALAKFGESAKRTYRPFSGTTVITDVVRASAESVSSLQANLNSLIAGYATMLASVDRLIAGLSNYSHKRVVTAVAARQMNRLRADFYNLESSFNNKTPDARAQTVRADTLRVLTNRANVRALANIRYPGDPKLSQTVAGSAKYRATAYGTGTAPSITGSVSAPWAVAGSHDLRFDIGGSLFTVDLLPATAGSVPGISAATLTGYQSESATAFAIHDDLEEPWDLNSPTVTTGGTYTVVGGYLYLVVNGVQFKVTDSVGSPFTGNRTAAQLAGDINTIAGTHVVASNVSGGGNDWVEISYKTSPRPPSEPVLYGNRYMQIATGPLSAASLLPANWFVDVDGTTPTAGYFSSGWDGNDELQIWPNSQSSSTTVDLPNGAWPNYVVSAATVDAAIDAAMGAHLASSVDSGRIKLTSNVLGDGSVLKITTSGLLGGTKTPSIRGAEVLGFYKDQEDRQAGFSSSALLDVLNNNATFSTHATASLTEELVYETKRAYGNAPDEVKVATNDTITATVGELKLDIEAGENRGSYGVSAYSSVGGTLTFELDRNLRDPSATNLRIRLYRELLTITALNSGTSSYIDVVETWPTSAHSVLGLPTAKTYGTVEQLWVEYNDPATGWVPANLKGRGIKVGDAIKNSTNAVVAYVTGIDSLGIGVVDVTPIDPLTSLTAFSIESVASDNHTSFNTTLTAWRDGITSEQESLSALIKAVNILLKVSNADRGRVQAAATELASIKSLVQTLQTHLESYSTPTIPAVDRALEVMSESGQDRARDLLTAAQFSEYNRTTYKTASFSGAMMAAASDVATKDLVEPTKTHGEFTSEIDKLIYSTADEIDPKFDFRDTRPESSPVYLDYFAYEIPRNK